MYSSTELYVNFVSVFVLVKPLGLGIKTIDCIVSESVCNIKPQNRQEIISHLVCIYILFPYLYVHGVHIFIFLSGWRVHWYNFSFFESQWRSCLNVRDYRRNRQVTWLKIDIIAQSWVPGCGKPTTKLYESVN